MFDIQTSPHFGLLNDISPKGSWENWWYGLLTQTLGQAGMKRWRESDRGRERDGRTRGMQGEEKCSVSAAHKAALAYLKNPRNPQRNCSDAVNMLQTGPVPPTLACYRLDCWGVNEWSQSLQMGR